MRFDPENQRIYVRQSWLGDYLTCPQRAKYALSMPTLRRGSDATAIGTGIHAVIEQYLREDIVDIDHMVTNARAFVTKEMDKDIKRTEISSDPEKMMGCVDSMVEAWWTEIRPHVQMGGLSEYPFKAPLHVNASNGYSIWLEGTIDYIAPDGSLWDWKTASKPYSNLEKQRQSHQATCYVAACRELGLVSNDEATTPFRFGVMVRQLKPKAQIVTVTRGAEQSDWLRRQAKSVVDTAISNWGHVDWTMNDQHFLCSSKWCDFWHLCKGAHWTEQSMMSADQTVDIRIPTPSDMVSSNPEPTMGESE